MTSAACKAKVIINVLLAGQACSFSMIGMSPCCLRLALGSLVLHKAEPVCLCQACITSMSRLGSLCGAGPSRQKPAGHNEARLTASAAALPSSPAAHSLHQSAPELRMQHTFSHATLEELRAATENFAMEREWEKFHSPRNLLLALVSAEWRVGSICLPYHLSYP